MKTISVKQVAAALDITPRAVIYRLEKKQLRGTQSPNAFGKQEWRVYPTKEIIEALKRNSAAVEQARQESSQSTDFDFTPDDADIVEADVYDGSSEVASDQENDSVSEPGARDWQGIARETMKSMAEELVRPLGELIKEQQERLVEQEVQIAERDQLIEEKDRQLRLLPDLESQKAKLLQEIEAERRAAEIQFARAAEKEEVAKALEAENAKLKQKAEEAALSLEKLQVLEDQMQKLQLPWWKKWLLPAGETQEKG